MHVVYRYERDLWCNDYFICSLHAATASGITELSTTSEGLSTGQTIAITFGTVTVVLSVIGGIVIPIYIENRRRSRREENK